MINLLSQPVNGTAVIQNGEVLYTPNQDYIGQDQFQYNFTDIYGRNTNIATVNIDVTGQTIIITQQPSSGSAEVVSGKVLYTPETGFIGTDSFKYTVISYPQQSFNEAIITVKVQPENLRFWTAVDDDIEATGETLIKVIDNDTITVIPNPDFNL